MIGAGDVYGFARNQRFDARNPLALRKDLLTQAQYGGTVGGPIHRDRTFLFTNFEQTAAQLLCGRLPLRPQQ